MKIAFIGEAVSGFGGMETVIREVLSTRVHFPIFA